ncbi:helix-turn-helix domain-containing protein [Corynebacterium sp. TAE3-ERU12]|uniref:helix-turn-helix domain-containing protein n=1 Tax=Corynebacterium sp. TAE3-ERU12 TaxID=2849491 RepID=UPI001C46ED9E|nr:helix-turn-helix domain-containing protein [Corynebacterium sp. TAE3-ERU12]MBV7294907.1 helix-turn-helix domain-containing protein [Corynebacterium sp. TAE3-ERU12]
MTSTIKRTTVTVTEFAATFAIDPQRVYRWCQAGRLRTLPKTPGSRQHWRILSSEIDRVIQSGFPPDPRSCA